MDLQLFTRWRINYIRMACNTSVLHHPLATFHAGKFSMLLLDGVKHIIYSLQGVRLCMSNYHFSVIFQIKFHGSYIKCHQPPFSQTNNKIVPHITSKGESSQQNIIKLISKHISAAPESHPTLNGSKFKDTVCYVTIYYNKVQIVPAHTSVKKHSYKTNIYSYFWFSQPPHSKSFIELMVGLILKNFFSIFSSTTPNFRNKKKGTMFLCKLQTKNGTLFQMDEYLELPRRQKPGTYFFSSLKKEWEKGKDVIKQFKCFNLNTSLKRV